MYILYMILGVIGFLALLVFIARVIWMQETHPDKKNKNKSNYVDSSMRCDKPWNNRINH